jgi:hypothetical protein
MEFTLMEMIIAAKIVGVGMEKVIDAVAAM